MILLILLLIPLVTGIILLQMKDIVLTRRLALSSALLNLLLTFVFLLIYPADTYSVSWLPFLGIQFELGYDGLSLLMLILTNLLFPFIIFAGFHREQKRVPLLNSLILLTQSALIGVFLARNAFLFYVFWELALIPVYFILLIWGGRGRRTITLKFFIYTLAGSLFLLFGIIYLYQLTPYPHTLDFSSLSGLNIPAGVQKWLFWVLFIAFAIKMPIFPFHTWQPQTYTMAPTQGVMILAGIMTKMGIYGALRILFPVVPLGVQYWQNTVIILALFGMIYASVIAFRQSNLKRLVAFSSMAHISLMAGAMFVLNQYALQGLFFQVLSHGVVIVALFYIVSLIEEKTGVSEFVQMGGIKHAAPDLSSLFLIVILASIAIPLTSGFIGELLMIAGLFKLSVWFGVLGATAMVLSAIYMLYAYQRSMLGERNANSGAITDIRSSDYLFLVPLVIIILALGIYPQPVFDLVEKSVTYLQGFLPLAVAALPTLIHPFL